MVAGKLPDWLPAGWTEHLKVNNGRKIKCYIDPLTGRKFYSKPQVSEYLRTVEGNSSISHQKKLENVTISNPNMGEITGDITSLKHEGSTNMRTPKRTSGAFKRKQTIFTKQSVEEVEIQRVKPDELPLGWIKETYYTDPISGYVFCSQQDALLYLETGDFSRCTVKPKKRNEMGFINGESSLTPNVGGLTGGEISLKQQGSQNVKTPNRTRYAYKQMQMDSSKQSVEKPNMGELTGGETSLKVQGSRNVKSLKRTSRASKRMQTGSGKQPVKKPIMSELTGGETSLKLEGSQNVNTLKRTGCRSKGRQTNSSKETVEKIAIERVTPDGLPPGWIKEIKIQKKANGTRKDSYYTDPVREYVFLSQKDALRYVETGDISSCTMKPKKRDELWFLNEKASLSTGEITGGETSLKQEGPQNGKTPKTESCVSKLKQMGSSKQSVEKVVIERVSVDGLPTGWTKEIKIQKKANGTRKDPYYTDPVSGYVFCSQKDALRYLETGDISSCSVKPKKRHELGFLTEETSLSPNTGELTGCKTSLKKEESENVKNATSFASKQKQMDFTEQSTNKVVIERVTPDGLPPGWIKEIKTQKKANGSRKDSYYTDPASGYVFVSQKDALRYVETGDLTKCSRKPKKRDQLQFLNEVAFPTVGKLTEGETSLKLEGSQDVKSPANTSCRSDSKEKQMGITTESMEKVLVERVAPAGLPPGWIKEIRIQVKENGKRRDPYYTDPVSGYVFASQKDALRYLETGDLSSCAIRPRKRDELKFLNQESSLSLSSEDIVEKVGHHTPINQLFQGTQNHVTSSLGAPEVSGLRKRRWTSISADESEKSADSIESYDPSYTPRVSTKSSKRKRGKKESAENGNASTPSTPVLQENGKVKRSNRRTQTDSSKYETEKALGSPTRSSQQITGPESEMVPAAMKSGETEARPLVGPLDNVAQSVPQIFQTLFDTDISDYALRETEIPSNVSLLNTSENQFEDYPVPEDQPVKQESEKKDEGNQDQKNPFGDSWSDPCLEFAFKALSGSMPMEDNLPTQHNFQQQTACSRTQTGGCLSLLNFGVPDFFQNNHLTDFDAPGKPVSDSIPQFPTAPTFLPSCSSGEPQQPKLEGDKEHHAKADS